MGRHADPSASRRLPRLSPRLAGTAAAVVVLLTVGGVVWATAGPSRSGGCDSTPVRVTVAPEAGALAHTLLAGPIPAGGCLCATAVVTAQQPLQTLGNLGALAPSALPQVWVPDSSLWAQRVTGTAVTPAGSLGSSPVVLATSSEVSKKLGWSYLPPTWSGALSTDHPLVMPDLTGSAEELAALGAVRTSMGGGDGADNAVVAAVLSAARGPSLSVAEALDRARKGGADAPIVPVSEQQVLATARGHQDSSLVAVYPSEGSPRLDYPVLRVGSVSGKQRQAVDAVVRALTSAKAQAAARAAGFRDRSGDPPAGAGSSGVQPQAPKNLALDPKALGALLTRIVGLAKPSRLLTVVDVSTSMRAPAGDGTRATLARDALKSALTLLPDDDSGGLWDFAYHLQGDQDWQQLAPIRDFGADGGGGRTQRQLLDAQFDSIPSRLTPGGTALYDTTLAAVRASRAAFDPNSVNSVVLITDGKNEDDAGISLTALLAKLKAEADPSRPVKVIGIGIGPDADMDALGKIADATGGAAYQALDPKDLQGVLFDAIRRRG